MASVEEDGCPCGSGKIYRQCCGKGGRPSVGAADSLASVGQALQAAANHFRAGRLARAKDTLEKLLCSHPNNADALHLLAAIAFRSGYVDAAVALATRAVESAPNVARFHCDLGNLLKTQGRIDDAIHSYQRALALNPGLLDAEYNIGVCHEERGRPEEAVEHLSRVLTERPRFARAHMALGNAYKRLGKSSAALRHYEKAASLAPNFADAHYNLANVLLEQGRDDDAIAHYERALLLKPEFVDAHINIGNALAKKGRSEEAMEHHKHAVELAPDSFVAHASLGNSCKAANKQRLAVLHYGRALSLEPDSCAVLRNLGSVLMEQGRLIEAQSVLESARRLESETAETHSLLGRVLRAQGLVDQAIPLLERATELQPDNPSFFSSLLVSLNYSSQREPAEVFRRHVEFGRRYTDHLMRPQSLSAVDLRRGGVIKIGYISADFRKHSVAYFIEPILAHHDSDRFEVFAYYNRDDQDEKTKTIRARCQHWRSIFNMADEEVAQLVRRDGIDILVDLSGHTGRNRLLVFGRKPAPVQVTWIGYPNTTGVQGIGYRITDAVADPPGLTDDLYTEELVRLPRCFLCYGAHDDGVGVSPLPALRKGHITFGSFNNFAKVTEDVLACYARILQAVKGSRLYLKSLGLGDSEVQARLRSFFGRRGISGDRLEVVGMDTLMEDHLRRYGEVDIALDPFPYNGTTTTCEAAWMGVPVVVLAGTTHAGRVGASLMTALGMQELIADSEEEYVATAVSLAGDLKRLQTLRKGMRSRMTTSALMDATGFTKQLEEAYEMMWERWCDREAGGASC